ncbi:hypothetical protein BsWGS_20643 [Bradybaena similaris]
MTEPVDDNIPIVDKIVYIQQDDQTLISDTDDGDDLHVCRKCNKVFKSLEEYLEHKVKYENYRISQTRSKLDRRMVLPQLVQKQKRKDKKEKNDNSKKNEVEMIAEPGGIESAPPTSFVIIGCDMSLEKSPIKDESITEVKQESVLQEQLPKKRGRKKKSAVSEVPTVRVDEEILYPCSQCDKKFRREATLRWHVKYEHRDDKENGEDSEDEHFEEASAENDRDFKIDIKKEQTETIHFTLDDDKTPQEIHVIIEQPENVDKLEGAEEQNKAFSRLPCKRPVVRFNGEAKDRELDRPYPCEICGRRFKEITVLKAHGVVHSNERKYVCTADNCPYGFKTKGGLVRHMRRHTGERPYACENCGRAFSESGALTRHMKSRRNCAQTPDSAYPRYMKNWTYHPNIPAVIDPSQRDIHQGRSTLQQSVDITHEEEAEGEIHYLITGATEASVVTAEIITAHVNVEAVSASVANAEILDNSSPSLEAKLEQDDAVEAVEWRPTIATVQGAASIITNTEILDEGLKPLNPVLSQQEITTATAQQDFSQHTQVIDPTQELAGVEPPPDVDLLDLKHNAEALSLRATQCRVCSKDLKTVEGLEIHLRSHLADQPSRCGLCHFLSHDREELRHHILSMHYDSLNDIEASVLSMEEEEGGLKGESFQDKKASTRDALIAVKQLYSLKKQTTTVEEEKSCPTASGALQCMVCSRIFRGSSYLRQHMRTHTGDRPHQCSVCYRSFTSRDILKKHMYVHKEQRDFKCGECGKLFKRLAHVQQHLRIHSQERTFRCSVCDKLYKTQHSLTVHVRTHSGVNPYRCHVCNRHFRERGSLQRHMRLHTGEKPYKCPLCHRAFAEHGTLSRHLKAKVPCSANRTNADMEHNLLSGSTMLTQFSTMVANTQQYIQAAGTSPQYIQHVGDSPQLILPSVHEVSEGYVVLDTTDKHSEGVIENVEVITEEELSQTARPDFYNGQETETLHIVDSDTGESVIIVAEKSIVDLIREQQLLFESGETGSSLQKIKDILHAVGNVTSFFPADLESQEMVGTEQQEIVTETLDAEIPEHGSGSSQMQSSCATSQ